MVLTLLNYSASAKMGLKWLEFRINAMMGLELVKLYRGIHCTNYCTMRS